MRCTQGGMCGTSEQKKSHHLWQCCEKCLGRFSHHYLQMACEFTTELTQTLQTVPNYSAYINAKLIKETARKNIFEVQELATISDKTKDLIGMQKKLEEFATKIKPGKQHKEYLQEYIEKIDTASTTGMNMTCIHSSLKIIFEMQNAPDLETIIENHLAQSKSLKVELPLGITHEFDKMLAAARKSGTLKHGEKKRTRCSSPAQSLKKQKKEKK